MSRCLYCYESLESGDYHRRCSKKIFGTTEAPLLPYSREIMKELAREIVTQRVSLTGVQAKISLHLEKPMAKKESRFTLVGLWGNYILKPPTELFPSMPEVEDCTMHLAELFKIPVVPHTLVRLSSGELAYLTRRIDRNVGTGTSIHMEDFCQLSGKLTEEKYRGSMESLSKIIRQYSSNALLDILNLFEVTLFSFLTGNGDMHLKNFSLIHNENGLITMTPAYDLLSTRLLIPEEEDNEELALTLNGKKRKLSLEDFLKFASTIGLSEKQVGNSLKKFQKSFKNCKEIVKTSFLSEELKNAYVELLVDRAGRLNLLHSKTT